MMSHNHTKSPDIKIYFMIFSVKNAEVGGAVEVAVGDGFHDVVVEDVGGAFEVGDGAGDFEDAVVGPCAHVHAFHGVQKMLF